MFCSSKKVFSDGYRLNLLQILRIIRARQRTIYWTVGAALIIALGISLLIPKQYVAQATLVVNSNSADPVLGASQQNTAIGSTYVTTQVDILNSPRVAQKAVSLLKSDWNAAQVSHGLNVKAGQGNVIEINYTSPDPESAAAVANALANAYLETALELRVDPARQNAKFFDLQTADLRRRLEQAQARLSDYQKKNGIINSGNDNRQDVDNARFAELSSQLTQIQAKRFDTQSRQNQAKGNVLTSPDVLQNPVVQQLRSQIASAQAKLKQLSMQLGPNHPQYISTASELAELNAKLNTEMAQVAGSVGSANRANLQSEAAIRAEMDAQRKKILALSSQNDDLSLLQREVTNAQSAYDLVMQRYSQTSLQSQSQQADVVLLSAATVPTRASSPKTGFNLALSMIVGLTLGLVLIFIREIMNPLIRSTDDILASVGIPVLAKIPNARPSRTSLLRWRPMSRITAARSAT